MEEHNMAVTRSPKYPQLSIADAIERVKRIYGKEKWHPATDEVLVQHMGYRGLNGASLGTLATLKRYGLLIPGGERKFRVSDDAVSIIEAPTDHPDWTAAMMRTAFNPPLFSELRETFGSNLPSDANLRHFLIKKKFNPKAAEEVIRVYRETLNTISSIQQSGVDSTAISTNEGERATDTSIQLSTEEPAITFKSTDQAATIPEQLSHPVTKGSVISEVFNVRLSSDCKAYIQYEGIVTQEAIQKLIKYLELAMDDFPSRDEVQ
jgi:hypothetical protein